MVGVGIRGVLPASNASGDHVGCDGVLLFDFGSYLANQTENPLLFPANLPRCVDIQAWYRDAANPGAADFSDALSLLVIPWDRAPLGLPPSGRQPAELNLGESSRVAA